MRPLPVKKSEKVSEKALTEGEMGAKILWKTKKVGCIRLTSSKGKEVNSEKISSCMGLSGCAGARCIRVFYFGMEVLRPLANYSMNSTRKSAIRRSDSSARPASRWASSRRQRLWTLRKNAVWIW